MSAQADALHLPAEAPAWPRLPLADVVDVLDKKRKPITKRNRVAGPYPYYGATGVLDWVDGYLFDEPLVLIGEDGAKWNAGAESAFAITGKTWVNNHAHVLRPNRERLIDDWLIYYLNATDLSGFISGMTVPKLNQGRLREIPIPVPPLDEQKRIVAVLDQAFAALDRARANAESNSNDCETLIEDTRNSIIADASTKGVVVRLSDVTSIDSKLVDPQTPDTADLLHVGAGNIQTGSDQLINVKSARAEELKSGKYLFDDQIILYSKIRPYLRKVARPDFSGLCSADVYPLSTSSTLDRNFLFHLLLSSRFTKYAIAGSDRAGMPKVNRKHLFDFEFPLPSYDRQQQAACRIDEALEKIRKIRERTEAKLPALSHLRSSLLQNAFSGEIG